MTRAEEEAHVGTEPLSTLIIGAGFSGLGAAMRLLDEGITDILVLERADEVGGTWRDHTYPGVACDVPSLLYSYSYEQNPNWSQTYASGAEIQQYILDVVAKRHLRPYVRFNQEVLAITWEQAHGWWVIETVDAVYRAQSVIASYGPLSTPSLPAIEGIDKFAGEIMHTARWDHDYDFTDKTVAVIGTGSTAVQLIPQLVRCAGAVRVFQRTPGWVYPTANRPTPAILQSVFRTLPQSQGALRSTAFRAFDLAAYAIVWNTPLTRILEFAGRAYLSKQVQDRWLQRRLSPQFRPGCKRMLGSSDYYKALQADNCELLTWPIARISEKGITTCEGIEHLADVLVCATGYHVTKTAPPITITGVDGRSLGAEWDKGAYAYKSVNIAGYPNLYLTFGPNSGPGHTSALAYMEAEIDYSVRMIKLMRARRLTALAVRPHAQAAYNRWIQERLAKTTWNSGGCRSWYLSENGFNATMFPGTARTFRNLLADIELSDYTATGVFDDAGTAGQGCSERPDSSGSRAPAR